MGVKRGIFNSGEDIKIASVRNLITQYNTLDDLPKDSKKGRKS